MRVLVVEDEKRLAETLADIISDSGDTVDVSNDGEDGYYNAASGIYDAIVLDVMLPKMNGFDILKKIREEGVSTPVLMLTARTQLGDRVNGLNLGEIIILLSLSRMKSLLPVSMPSCAGSRNISRRT